MLARLLASRAPLAPRAGRTGSPSAPRCFPRVPSPIRAPWLGPSRRLRFGPFPRFRTAAARRPGFHLILASGDLEDQRLGAHVHDAGAEDLGDLKNLARFLWSARTLMRARSRTTEGRFETSFTSRTWTDFVEVRFHQRRRAVVGVHHHGDVRHSRPGRYVRRSDDSML